ncbi:hypothetical protein [Mycoplasma sp. Ms02]|uniref:hypothetical protein n=1 Tax=Mycoplasma sp. Ms02 TaxID=353851 RepID=UPI001C8AEA97|nr:hypothetical protein [Mycoplasma sp. Ms02]QZE12129.1 hypothetical protein K4L35_02140 [Mycoplasma sp. Ms02]
MKFFKRHFQNYKARKIAYIVVVLALLTSIICTISLLANFDPLMKAELEWLQKGHFEETITQKEILETSKTKSELYQLRHVFKSFNFILLALFTSGFAISIAIVVNLFTNKYNGQTISKILLTIITVSLVLTFLLLSLKPLPSARDAQLVINGNVRIIQNFRQGMEYTAGYISFICAWIVLIFTIIARRRFGYLTNDQTLAKKYKDTETYKLQIDEVLNS